MYGKWEAKKILTAGMQTPKKNNKRNFIKNG